MRPSPPGPRRSGRGGRRRWRWYRSRRWRPARPAFRTIWGRPMIRWPGNGPSGMGSGSR
nr:MAG TPA: hypothetical protein [Caudoviricetes sp.]